MHNPVIQSYENYREEYRLTTNNARKIEWITTVRIMAEWLMPGSRVLDCAAGTGVYAFHLADTGHQVTATDLTPRHIALIRAQLKNRGRSMETAVLDATDLSVFADRSFDAVLNMGPMYHLVEKEQREKCISESVRVLKQGGLLFCTYIPRYFVFQHVAMTDSRFLDPRLARQLIETGVLRHSDEKCFWTDTYYAAPAEIEALLAAQNLTIIDHFAQDGLAPTFSKTADQWDKEQFRIWCEYHYSICREPSVLGATNHAMIIGKKL